MVQQRALDSAPTTGASAPLEGSRGAPPPRANQAGRVVAVAAPFPRAVTRYAESWRRYLFCTQAQQDIPIVRPTFALAGHALIDELLLGFGGLLLRPIPTDVLERIEHEALAALEMYTAAGWLQTPDRFHQTPPRLTDPDLRPMQTLGLQYTRLAFESGYEPHPGEPGRERWLAYKANQRALAWVLRHDEPRPWLVCVHGAMMGRASVDLRLFRARWLHEDLGLNVVVPVQPLHGARRRNVPSGAQYPREDLLDNVHGAAQAVWDIRRVLSWVRHTDPGVPIGITGISLGALATSLAASLDDGLVCVIVGAPAVDLAHVLERVASAYGAEKLRSLLTLAKQLGPVVSPLAMTPRVPHEGRFIYAGLADKLVHPRRQVVQLWQHWDRPAVEWYPGGHMGFARSKPVGKFIGKALVDSGLVTHVPSTSSPTLASATSAARRSTPGRV